VVLAIDTVLVLRTCVTVSHHVSELVDRAGRGTRRASRRGGQRGTERGFWSTEAGEGEGTSAAASGRCTPAALLGGRKMDAPASPCSAGRCVRAEQQQALLAATAIKSRRRAGWPAGARRNSTGSRGGPEEEH
jgi:hypothetical protein